MIHQIYILAIIVISIVIFVYFYTQQAEYRRELERIDRLESRHIQKEKNLELIRSQTIPCHISGLDTPRKCYFQSGYACAWNELADRCDSKMN